MSKYRGLFMILSTMIWALALWGISKIKPELLTDMFKDQTAIQADKDKPKPPPPPPPPKEKLPPPPPLVERETKSPVQVAAPPQQEEVRQTAPVAPPPAPPAPPAPAYEPPPPPPPPPSCTESPHNVRVRRGFNIERAYPARAQERDIEGTVQATLNVDASGSVTNVSVTSSNPPGVFESAVEREGMRMTFEPARRDCANVASTYSLSVQFRLED